MQHAKSGKTLKGAWDPLPRAIVHWDLPAELAAESKY